MNSQVLQKISISNFKDKSRQKWWMQAWKYQSISNKNVNFEDIIYSKDALKKKSFVKNTIKENWRIDIKYRHFSSISDPKSQFFSGELQKKDPKNSLQISWFISSNETPSIDQYFDFKFSNQHPRQNKLNKGRRRDPLTIYSYHSNKFSQIDILITLKHNNSFIKIV